MTSKRFNIILAVALLLSPGLKAQFRYSASLDPVKETGFYSIVITPELSSYLKTDLSDLRIIDEKKQTVPFIIDQPWSGLIEYPTPEKKIILKETDDSKTTLVIENTNETELSAFFLILKSAAARRTASLSGSNDNKHWFVILDSLGLHPFDLNNQTSEWIKFPVSDYSYFRLVINNEAKYPLNILAVKASGPILPSNVLLQGLSLNPAPEILQSDSAGYSLVRMVSPNPFQVSMLRLRIANPSFYLRKAKVFTEIRNSLPATWHSPSHDTITISSDDYSDHYTPIIKADTLYLVIENGDNPPLQISSVTTGILNRYFTAYLEKDRSYILLLDNPAAITPVYDLEHFKNRIKAIDTLNVATITALSQPETNITPKQANKRWIWPVIILVIISLSILTWRLTKDMKKNTAN